MKALELALELALGPWLALALARELAAFSEPPFALSASVGPPTGSDPVSALSCAACHRRNRIHKRQDHGPAEQAHQDEACSSGSNLFFRIYS